MPAGGASKAEVGKIDLHNIKQYRGIAIRYEKTVRNFLAGLHLVCAMAWLK